MTLKIEQAHTRSNKTKLERVYRYGDMLNTHDLVKIVAVTLMVVDHIGRYLVVPQEADWYRLLGRFAAPLFFFLIGYTAKLRITPTLVIYGLSLSFVGFLMRGYWWHNILLNFIMVQYCLWWFPPERLSTFWRVIGFSTALLLTPLITPYVEYGGLGVMIAYSARLVALKDPTADTWLVISLIVYLFWESIVFQFLSRVDYMQVLIVLSAVVFIALRNYTVQPIGCPHFLRRPLLLLSRYSLHLYFVHFMAFELFELVTLYRLQGPS